MTSHKPQSVPSRKSSPAETPDFISQQVEESDYFFLDLKPAKRCDFTVTCGGLECCSPGYQVDRNRFRYYGMEYIVSGACSLVLDGRSYNLRPGSIFCYGPRTPHQIRNSGNGPLVKFFVDFTGRDAAKMITDPFLKSSSPYQVPNLRNMHGFFRQILETGKQGGKGCQRILRQMVELIVLTTRFKAVDLEETDSRSYKTYARCRTEIEGNYTTIRSVEDLAERCHVSSGHLCRIFRKFADESPWQIITRLRMNDAGELLVNDKLMIKDVALKTGFHDAYHFSRVFKDYYGMSPRQFRQSLDLSSP